MENYALAKKIMFDNLKDNGYSIVNYDDSYKDLYITNNNILYLTIYYFQFYMDISDNNLYPLYFYLPNLK